MANCQTVRQAAEPVDQAPSPLNLKESEADEQTRQSVLLESALRRPVAICTERESKERPIPTIRPILALNAGEYCILG